MPAHRLLIYTRYGLVWSCRSDKEIYETTGPHAQTWLWWKHYVAKSSLEVEVPMMPRSPGVNDTYHWRHLWFGIVSVYNTLELTYAGDKLPAVAGIAKAFQRRIGEEVRFGVLGDGPRLSAGLVAGTQSRAQARRTKQGHCRLASGRGRCHPQLVVGICLRAAHDQWNTEL